MIETNEDINALKSICERIGYGNACDIICKAWDEMLKESYGLKPYHGDNWMKQKRSAIEAQEKMQQVIKTLKSQIQDNCEHDWKLSPIAGDGYKCFKCGALDLKDD